MVLRLHQLTQQQLVLGADLLLVPLHEAQQGLVPNDRQLPGLFPEPEEVVHQRVHHPERQRVLLVQQHAEEEGRGARVRQLRELQQRRGGVKHRDGPPREHRRQHHSLPQRARPRGAQGNQYPLVKGRGLERRLLQRLIQREVQPLVLGDVVPDARQQHERVEPLRHLRVEVRREQPRRLEHGVRAPLLRVGEVQHLLPVAQRGYNLERLGNLAHGVPLEQVAHLPVDVDHLLVDSLGHGREVVVVAAARATRAAPAALLLLDLLQDDVRERPFLARLGRHERAERLLVLRRYLDVLVVIVIGTLGTRAVVVAVAVVVEGSRGANPESVAARAHRVVLVVLVLVAVLVNGGLDEAASERRARDRPAAAAAAIIVGARLHLLELLPRGEHDLVAHGVGHEVILLGLALALLGPALALRELVVGELVGERRILRLEVAGQLSGALVRHGR